MTLLIYSVGSGKSSIISAILGEIYKVSGSVTVRGTIAYVPQTAWIMNATVRDNILFGNKYDESFYTIAIKACGLDKDLEILSFGDDQLVLIVKLIFGSFGDPLLRIINLMNMKLFNICDNI